MTVPVVGHVIVLGYLASVLFSGIETAVMVGALGQRSIASACRRIA
jgi:hypothetical protein